MSRSSRIQHNDGIIDVEFSYYPHRCNRVGHIDNWLPDDEEELEIISITYQGVDVGPLMSEDDRIAIEEKIYADLQ